MHYLELDSEHILSTSQQWLDLQLQWGDPIDLDTPESSTAELTPASSTYSLNRTTFDSAKYIAKLKRAKNATKLQLSLAYDDFTEGISPNCSIAENRPFYFVGGSIISKNSVEDICRVIDDVFSDLEPKVVTSTMRAAERRKQRLQSSFPSILEHSVDLTGLSFDDTVEESCERAPKRRIVPAAAMSDKSLEGVIGYIDRIFGIIC